MNRYSVAIAQQSRTTYSNQLPYHPPESFPESPFSSQTDPTNEAYSSLRELFVLLKFDSGAFGSPDWNPLGWLIRPGDTVFLKPNMIAEKHYHSDEWEFVITHGSVIRAVIDYVFIALRGEGKIIVGDAPSTEANFDEIVRRMGLREIQSLYWEAKQFEIEIVDLRDEYWIEKDRVVLDTIQLPGDPRGKTTINLDGKSMFAEVDQDGRHYYGAFYDSVETNRHHREGTHEYSISKSPLAADVFLSIPKLKTHKKCGLTVNLKGLVGINANKNWLPHYCYGSPETGGDQFATASARNDLENAVVRRAKKALLDKNPAMQMLARKTKKLAYKVFGETESIIRSGNWHGNDTVWRMALDLNRILLYANPDGSMRESNAAKRYFSVVDGIIAMEGDGPATGTPKAIGCMLAGQNPVAIDAVCARLMGFDYRKLPIVSQAFEPHPFPLIEAGVESIDTLSNKPVWNGSLTEWRLADVFKFEPHFGWKGKVEAAE
ncbi:MAG TPA: DUF362 domain-containing protein [Pyrinomonadaceae bacterium]